ncbi:hypothetical protein [Nostoc sp. CHAB 5715]|nr:hypothetical protein [Nostoc sp. CHAB 5715]
MATPIVSGVAALILEKYSCVSCHLTQNLLPKPYKKVSY